jgi:hypothetical protein
MLRTFEKSAEEQIQAYEGGTTKLYNEDLHGLYSPNIISMTKSRKVRWAGHVAWLREKYMQDSAGET